MSSSLTISGMAASIRAATESETFDLAGNSPATITTTIQSAFSTPLNITTMIRITFITGAGKLGRSKYDDNAARTVSSVLRELGYVEDRGASCVNECAGMFKSQHDTGKNLKTIVVFPILIDDEGEDAATLGGTGNKKSEPSLLEEGSPKEMIAMSSNMNMFQKMISNKCQSWSQKKTCLAILSDLKTMLDTLDSKLLHGKILTDVEQEFYDAIAMDSLEAKATFVRDEMKKHIDEGKVTKLEKEKLVTQVREKMNALEKDIEEATNDKKMKKVNKLSTQKEKLMDRLAVLENINPIPPSPLKHQPEIQKLRKEMQPLLKLERETKGRLLSIKETTTLARKDEIEEDIFILEEKSRGWFEEEEDFQLRVAASRAKAVTATKKTVKKSTSSSASTKPGVKKSITNWVVPGAGKKASNKKPATKKTATANAFAAMMLDSDSDSD